MRVLICNKDNPHQGCESIPLPIPDEEYDHCIERLKALGIGGVVARDCYVDQIEDAPPVLDMLEGELINIDEMDFLARSLDRYTDEELAKFQCMAVERGYTDMTDLINLSFCCEQTTVITDFSDLEKIGKNHYLATHDGVPSDVYDALNGKGIARELIASGEGQITPYGVIYDNGMQLRQTYAGQKFPSYMDKEYLLVLELCPTPSVPQETPFPELALPMTENRLQRLLRRNGYDSASDIVYDPWFSTLPEPVYDQIDITKDNLSELNRMCMAVAKLDGPDRERLAAAVLMAKPEGSLQICRLAENLEFFDFIPNINTPEDYGKFMIQKSGHFDYDENLIGFYDYKGYGEQRIASESGEFNEMGYISYHGTLSLEDLMREEPSEQAPVQGRTMGGLS